MYSGEPAEGLVFFQLLSESDEFCAQLGRVVLAAGRLESALVQVLESDESAKDLSRATLGQLSGEAKKHHSLNRIANSLEMVADQRNYLLHNIHALLSDRLEETILEKRDLLDSDVWTYTERASALTDNLNGLAEIVEKQMRDCS